MAIEKTYSPFSAPPPEAMDAPEVDESGAQPLSASLLGGREVSEGDVVRVRVVKPVGEDGMWLGVYDEGGKPKPSRLGNEMALETPMEGM